MIQTPKMFVLQKRIDTLVDLCTKDPDDYMLLFELEEARIAYGKLERIERLGLKVVLGGLHPSNTSTEKASKTS